VKTHYSIYLGGVCYTLPESSSCQPGSLFSIVETIGTLALEILQTARAAAHKCLGFIQNNPLEFLCFSLGELQGNPVFDNPDPEKVKAPHHLTPQYTSQNTESPTANVPIP
jgi:hypothetical protein